MTIQKKNFRTVRGAFDFLQSLAIDKQHDFYFRGHGDETWDLGTTYSRHRLTPLGAGRNDLEELIDHFIGSLLSTGKTLPFKSDDLRSKLEYARHYGLPSPLLDWSFSPYVAVFFAFNGKRPNPKKRSVIYALNLNGLADICARRTSMTPRGTPPGH